MATETIIKKDRISDLPDSLLLHILSFLKTTQYTVQTCILSTRWKNLWKQSYVLLLDSEQFKTLRVFTKFVSQLLSLRDEGTSLHTLKMSSEHSMAIKPRLFERILKYAVSHNVKNLELLLDYDIQHFPSCLFSCHTLTSLVFYVSPEHYDKHGILFPNSLNLPSLTKLDIAFVTFCGGTEPFSSCPRLIRLKISCFDILGEQNLCISSATLVKLAIKTKFKPNNNAIELSTPSLRNFSFTGVPIQILFGSHLSSVEQIKIDVDIWLNRAKVPSILLSWLLQLANIKILTVSSHTLQALASLPGLLKVKLHSLHNLKKLRVKMKKHGCLSKPLVKRNLAQLHAVSEEEVAKLIVEFLLQNSALAEVCYF